MNKEQFRKELEDCWKAGCNAMLYDLGHTATNHPDRDTYITTRLAGNDERKKHEGVARTFRALDVLAEQLHTTKKLLQEYKKEISDGAALPVADGKGELFITNESIKAGNEMANKLFAEDDKEFHVPDGEGEKVGEWQLCPKCNGDGNLLRYNPPAMMGTNANPICDVCNGGKILPKPLLPSAVMGGVKWVKASERLPTEPGDYFVKVDFSTHIGNDCIDFNGEEFDSGNVIEWLSEGQPE